MLAQFYLNEFGILGTERVNAMSEGAIPITRMTERARQIDEDDIDMYEQIILQSDSAYLKMRHEQSEAERKKEGGK